MNNPKASNTRRHFLRDVSVIAAATGMATVANGVLAQSDLDVNSSQDHAQEIDLGLKPSPSAFGAVVVPKDRLVFATFAASSEGMQGMAIVELVGCAAWRSRAAGDEATAAHAVDIEGLAVCNTYEVANSSWIAGLDPSNSSDPSQLRHIIFTFLGVDPVVSTAGRHFECLVEGINASLVSSGPFEDVIEYIDLLDANV